MPDARPLGIAARIRAWWRRGYDAELLALAPATDEQGAPLVWDFPHPVNRSPGWRLLRPWVLFPACIFIAPPVVLLAVSGTLEAPSFGELAFLGALAAMVGSGVRQRQLPRIQQRALRTYRQYRWRATRALDEAIEQARTPKRLVDTPAPRPPR